MTAVTDEDLQRAEATAYAIARTCPDKAVAVLREAAAMRRGCRGEGEFLAAFDDRVADLIEAEPQRALEIMEQAKFNRLLCLAGAH